MSCPDIYLGPDRANAPPTPVWMNPAIAPPSTNLTQGTLYSIPVTARNHGTDNSPETRLALYWSDPTTGFLKLPGRMIGQANIFIPGAIEFPVASDGEFEQPFGWTPDASAVATNGGHVCLLACMENLVAPTGAGCSQQFCGADPTVDPLSAIRNIHVYAPPPPPPPPPSPQPGDPGGGGGGREFMAFAFAATNTLLDTEKTRLSVRALHPVKDRARLQLLVSDPVVDQALARCCVKLAEPDAVMLAAGRERVLVPQKLWAGRGGARLEGGQDRYRLGHLGPVNMDRLKHLVLPGTKPADVRGPTDLQLLPGEMQHTIVMVRPSAREQVAHVIDVEHTAADGRSIGGLTLIFVPPHNYFDEKSAG